MRILPSQKGFSPIILLVVIGILAIGGIVLVTSGKLPSLDTIKQQTSILPQQKDTDSPLKPIVSNLEKTYGGQIPWNNLSNRESYKFYPKVIKGLTLATSTITENHDNNFNPLAVLSLTDSASIPLKNSYVSYYEVPGVLLDEFKLGEGDFAVPVELKVYEFDRKVSASEKSITEKGENFKCTNEKSKTEKTSFISQQVIIYYCDLNLTEEQKTELSKTEFFDKIYEIYLLDRNVLLQFGVDSHYIDNPQDYLSDYLSKIFNSNEGLFVTQSQIRSVEKAREFEEWRHKTFDK